jgi:aspartate aminotransferase-like enzyme
MSDRAKARAEAIAHRGFYTDLLRYRDKHQAGGTITTPAISTIYAANVQLGHILDEGIENRWARHHANHARVTEWAGGSGFTFFAPTHQSPTVSCLLPPAGISAPEVFSTLAERGWTIGTGYGPLKPDAIRIGHMGEVTVEDLDGLLVAIDEIVAELR